MKILGKKEKIRANLINLEFHQHADRWEGWKVELDRSHVAHVALSNRCNHHALICNGDLRKKMPPKNKSHPGEGQDPLYHAVS